MRSILLLLGLLLSACAGDAGCRLERVVELPVRMLRNVPVVEAEINGRPATMVLDTGADTMVLSRAAAARLDVPTGELARGVQGAGGATTARLGRVEQLRLGGAALGPEAVVVTEALPAGFDGLLGISTLVAFELDLDVPTGRATLYRARQCPAAQPGWGRPVVRLPTQLSGRSGHLVVSVRVDDQMFRGVLDTGASRTALSVQAAADLGIDQQRLRRLPGERGQAVNAGGIVVRTQRFRAMTIGLDVMEAPVLSITDLPPFAGDVLVGSDYLATRRVWFSFLMGAVFVERR